MADIIVQAFQQAINLIASGDPEVYATIYRTIYVAGLGTLTILPVEHSPCSDYRFAQF